MKFRMLLMLFVLQGAACDIIDFDSSCLELGGDTYTGVWTVTGSGTLSDCEPGSAFDGPVSLTARSLEVERQGSDKLVLINGPEGFRIVSSDISGSSITFVTEEDTSEGVIRIQFSGRREDCAFVEGEMTGKMPGGCSLDGSFALEVAPTTDFTAELRERFEVEGQDDGDARVEGMNEETPDAGESESEDEE